MQANLKVKVKKAELLEKLKTNRDQHAKIVAEARLGYVEKAKQALAEKLEALEKGRVVALAFPLWVPSDHTQTYNTTIGMLEMSTDDVIELSSNEYRMFVEDVWDWEKDFLISNAQYSQTSALTALSKGYQVNDE